MLVEDPGLEERLDQREHPLVLDPPSHPVHEGRVVDGVKARLDVRVQHPPVTGGGQMMDLGDGVVRAPVRPEPIRARPEIGLEDGFRTSFSAAWTTRSVMVGIPSRRSFPPVLGTIFSRTGSGRNVPVFSRERT